MFIETILLKQNKFFLNIVLNYKLSFNNCKKLLYNNSNNCVFCIKIFVYSLCYFLKVVKQKLVLFNNIYNIAINLKIVLNSIVNKIELREDYIIKNKKYNLIDKIN